MGMICGDFNINILYYFRYILKIISRNEAPTSLERAQKTSLLFNDPSLVNVFKALQKGERNIFNQNFIKV